MNKKVISLSLAKVCDAGFCNFCTRNKKDWEANVWVLGSKDPNRCMVVTICPDCMEDLKKTLEESEGVA